MPDYYLSPTHTSNNPPGISPPGTSPPTTGVLLANLGTPDAPTTPALRRFLRQFLSDRRIVELPRWQWLPILHGIILRTRPAHSAKLYQSIWTAEGSPLRVTALAQVAALQTELGSQVKVVLGMRYGNPSLTAALDELRAANIRRLLVLPLFPQYSGTTTASVLDALMEKFQRWRVIPSLRVVADYHDHPTYIRALTNSIREAWEEGDQPDKLLFSFHGIPQACADGGDPYAEQCHRTASLVAESLALADDCWRMAFQSRFGRAEWIKPYTDETLHTWGREGVRRVDVICPGFSADSLETLEEIDKENRHLFLEAGGEEFRYIPALNVRSDHIQMMVEIVRENGAGWGGFTR